MGFTPSQRDAPVSAQSGIEIIPVMEDKDGYKAILRSWRSLCLFECCLNTSVNISVPFCYIHVTLHVCFSCVCSLRTLRCHLANRFLHFATPLTSLKLWLQGSNWKPRIGALAVNPSLFLSWLMIALPLGEQLFPLLATNPPSDTVSIVWLTFNRFSVRFVDRAVL